MIQTNEGVEVEMVERGLLELKEIIEERTGHVLIGIESDIINLKYIVYNDEIIIGDDEILIESDKLSVSIPIQKEVALFKNSSETDCILKNDCMNLHFDFIGA